MLLETRKSILMQYRIFRDLMKKKIIQKLETVCQFKNRTANKQLIITAASHYG